jgi:hypothetical protein
MQALRFGLKITLLILILGGARASFAQAAATASDGWRKVNADGLFTFYLPPDMKQVDVQGVENFYQQYTSEKLTLSFVYEPDGVLAYSAREAEFGKDYSEIATEIDGRKALLFIYHRDAEDNNPKTYNADVYVGDLPRAQVKLWMWASSTSPDVTDIARRIFNSVNFTEDKPKPH